MYAGIAGAGLMGRLLAWKLSVLGWSVTLFDADITGRQSAAYSAAGMLSPYAELEADPLIFKLGIQGILLWEKLLLQFTNQSWLQKHGSIVVAHSSDKNELGNFILHIKQKISDSAITVLNAKNIKQYEPELQCLEGLYISGEATIDTRVLLTELNSLILQTKKVILVNKKINRVISRQLITDTNEIYKFDCVFDCRGIGGRENFLDLRAVRGELMYLYAPDVKISRPVRLLHPRYRFYVVPRSQSIYIVGASEIEAEDNSPLSVRTCLELLSAAYSLHRGFAEARIIEMSVGLRPALPNNLPKIQYREGMVAVNGLYRHGYLVAPVLLEEIINHLHTSNYRSPYPQLIQEGEY